MFRKDPVHVTLSLRTRIACVAAVAALLLPALSAGAWAAEDTGIRWWNPSNNNMRAGVYNERGNTSASNGYVVIYTGNSQWRVYGGYNTSPGEHSYALGNSVTMNSGGVVKRIYGGYSKGDAIRNTVTMNGGEVKGIIYGGYSQDGMAFHNSVTMNGGTVESITGGFSESGIDGKKIVSNNKVTINGGTVTKSIYGGETTEFAMVNTVTLSGAPTLRGVKIYGGELKYDIQIQNRRPRLFSKNTLVLDRYRGTSTVGEVDYFQFYNFILESGSQPLNVGSITFGDGRTSSEVQYINTIGMSVPKKVTLIRATNSMTGKIKQGTVGGKALDGAITIAYKWDLSKENNDKDLVATLHDSGKAPTNNLNNFISLYDLLLYGIGDIEISPETKSLLEGRLGGTVTLTQAADLLAGRGMNAMLSSVSQSSFSIWGAMGGGTSRYNTGSHINSDGIGFMVGAAWRKHTGPGTLTLSPFFAFGWGNYTSHNSFAGVGSVKGKGNTNYQGGGLMARYNHTNTGWHAEASVQLGHVKQDYTSSDFLDNYYNDTKYAINQMYTSMHFGIGKEIALSNCSVLDVYGKYFWTHTGKKDRDIAGDVYKFAAVNSHRARFGARYTHTVATGSGEVKPYAGAAYEYEFNGKGRGRVIGIRIADMRLQGNIADTRLQGSTGLLEAGIDYAPTSKKWALNAGVTGFVGKRRGIMGQLGIRADF